jgi:hypothetical protein
MAIPLTAERTVLTAIEAVHGNVANCIDNLCANGPPGADVTWDLITDYTASNVIAGFVSTSKAEMLQRFANHMSAAPGGPVVVSTDAGGVTLMETATHGTLETAAGYFGGNCLPNLCTNVPGAQITWDLASGAGRAEPRNPATMGLTGLPFSF